MVAPPGRRLAAVACSNFLTEGTVGGREKYLLPHVRGGGGSLSQDAVEARSQCWAPTVACPDAPPKSRSL
eukprot:13597423-Alexandrium_andersonii.AAC.1